MALPKRYLGYKQQPDYENDYYHVAVTSDIPGAKSSIDYTPAEI